MFVLTAASYAQAENVVSLPSPKPIFQNDAVVIEINSDVAPARLPNLFVEFDGEDVTPKVTLNGLTVSYKPSSDLQIGDHVIRIFEHIGDEHYNELQRLTVRVQSNGASGAEVWGVATGRYNYLLHEETNSTYNNIRRPDRNSGSGYLETNALAGGESWDASAHITGNYDTADWHNQSDSRGQLGEYLLTTRAFGQDSSATFKLGNHNTGISNILIDGFNRRGASMQLDLANSVKITAFSQDPLKAIGNANILGVQDDTERVDGAHIMLHPLGEDTHLLFELAYSYGEGRQRGGYGDAAFDPTKVRGQGSMFAGEWQGLANKVNLRGEFADTSFDPDGKITDVTALNGKAYHGVATYALLGDLDPRTYDEKNWTLTLDRKKIGSYFHSMANNRLPADQDSYSLTSNFNHETLAITGNAWTSTNNVDRFDFIPTDSTDSASLQISLTPEYVGIKPNDSNSWFALSNFTFGLNGTRQHRDKTPAIFLGNDLEQRVKGTNIGWNTALTDKLNLNLSHTTTSFSDSIDSNNNQHSALSEISIGYTPSDRLNFNLSLQYEHARFATSDGRGNYFAGLDVGYVIIPDVLVSNSHGSLQLNDSGNEDEQYNASTELMWTFVQAERNKPGYGIAWSANYQRVEEGYTTVRYDAGNQFTTFLSLKINAPYGW